MKTPNEWTVLSERMDVNTQLLRAILSAIQSIPSAGTSGALNVPVGGNASIELPSTLSVTQGSDWEVTIANQPIEVTIAGSASWGVHQVMNIAPGAFASIQPPSNQTWMIVNIYHTHDCEVYVQDGTHQHGPVLTATGNGAMLSWQFFLTNTHYLRIKNTHGSATNRIIIEGRRIVS